MVQVTDKGKGQGAGGEGSVAEEDAPLHESRLMGVGGSLRRALGAASRTMSRLRASLGASRAELR